MALCTRVFLLAALPIMLTALYAHRAAASQNDALSQVAQQQSPNREGFAREVFKQHVDKQSPEQNENETLYAAYIRAVAALIKERWLPPKTSSALAAAVEIHLDTDGEIRDFSLASSSGAYKFDASVLTAVADSMQKYLPPPPAGLNTFQIKFSSHEVRDMNAPQMTREQILAQAIANARNDAEKQTSKDRDDLAKELADLQKSMQGSGGATGSDNGGQRFQKSNNGQSAAYLRAVASLIKERWAFPKLNSPTVLKATVEVRLNRDGHIRHYSLIEHSGRQDFDASILTAVAEAQQVNLLPPPPPGLDVIRINFNSQELR